MQKLSRGECMAISEAQKRAVAKYNAKSYDEIKLRPFRIKGCKRQKRHHSGHSRKTREKCKRIYQRSGRG